MESAMSHSMSALRNDDRTSIFPLSIEEIVVAKDEEEDQRLNMGKSMQLFSLHHRHPKKMHSAWKNPLSLFLISLALAWIYLVIPVTNFWVFSLVKTEWWVLVVTIAQCEFKDFCQPDVLPITYHASYVLSFVAIIIIRVYQGLDNQEQNFEINTLFILAVGLIVNILYGLDTFLYNVHHPNEDESRMTVTDYDFHLEGVVSNPIRDSKVQGHTKQITNKLEQSLRSLDRANHHGSPQCAFFDLFLMSGCGAAHSSNQDNGRGITTTPAAHDTNSGDSRSKCRTEFLQVEKKYVQVFLPRLTEPTQSSSSSSSSSTEHVNHTGTPPPTGFSSVFQFLPRYQYDRSISRKAPMVIGSRNRLWVVGAIYSILINCLHTFLIYYTTFFRYLSNNNASDVTLIALFMVFVMFCTVFRFVIKRIGLECDKLKMNTTSMFFVAEYTCLMFYYMFYRVLFESIPNWQTFFALESCHLFFEWVCYPLRASDTFKRVVVLISGASSTTSTTTSTTSGVSGTWYQAVVDSLTCPYGLNHEDWRYFVALDFGIRSFIVGVSGASFVVIILSVSFMPWIRNNALAETGGNLSFTMALVVVSVIIEVLNALIINYFFFTKKNLDVFAVLMDCFQDDRFAFITTVLGAGLIINPIYAFLN